MSEFRKKRTKTLRNLAEKAGIEDADKLEREDLLKALELDNEPKPESDENIVPETEQPKAEGKQKEETVPAPDLPKEVVSSIALGISDEHTPVGSKAEKMKHFLAKQPKAPLFIPVEQNEPKGTTWPVIMNGYRLNVMKGVTVMVPQQVAEHVYECLEARGKSFQNVKIIQ